MTRDNFPGRRGILSLLGCGMLLAAMQPAAAQSVEQFYKGRNITLFVASAPAA